ncbi:hypothetical protein KM043_010800 [Ampulex compressa]|nr:hypothetical protein KM043_010800 [Ampulex compressa]
MEKSRRRFMILETRLRVEPDSNSEYYQVYDRWNRTAAGTRAARRLDVRRTVLVQPLREQTPRKTYQTELRPWNLDARSAKREESPLFARDRTEPQEKGESHHRSKTYALFPPESISIRLFAILALSKSKGDFQEGEAPSLPVRSEQCEPRVEAGRDGDRGETEERFEPRPIVLCTRYIGRTTVRYGPFPSSHIFQAAPIDAPRGDSRNDAKAGGREYPHCTSLFSAHRNEIRERDSWPARYVRPSATLATMVEHLAAQGGF